MRTSALLSVKVPADAKVFVNDRSTTSTGSQREYISRDLRPGASYSYTVRAEFERDGKPVTEEKSVRLIAGQTASLSFSESEEEVAKDDETLTKLTVRLPADARLYLAGHETKASGEVREFSTSKLSAGAEWTSYAIRAVVNRDGHEEVREQTVTLAAGESREISINFDAPQVADKVADASTR
jgi:uncharacterized protein (TIGR03000 family)